MKSKRTTASTIDEYIAEFPPATKKVLKQLRTVIRKAAPGVKERISYAIPVFDLNGRYLVYIAGWKSHISLYPVTAGVTRELKDKLKPYQSGKGTLKFPLEKPVPVGLIRQIVKSRIKEVRGNEK
jgi:uncharacterized protein YdhG (YjbR/CyaY superfamily)